MTMIRQRLARCGVCHRETLVFALLSVSSFGTPDLDGRPAEPARSALFALTQFCPHCGYAARDVSRAPDGVGEIVFSGPYQVLVAAASVPEWARSHLLAAFIAERRGRKLEAGIFYLYAAWAADDEHALEDAADFRMRAVQCFERARSGRSLWGEEPGARELLLADLYRRAGRFEEGVRFALKGLACGLGDEGDLAILLQLEVALAEGRDSLAHGQDGGSTASNRSNSFGLL